METPEQYTVKTPEEILKRTFGDYLSFYGKASLIKCMKEYSSELIKENERLKGTLGAEAVRQNMELKEVLTEVLEKCDGVTNPPCYIDSVLFTKIQSVLSKFQPKKDESHDATIETR